VGIRFEMDARLAGIISDAENAIRELNAAARPSLAPLARLLLRAESIASSRAEGMQVDVRQPARAEARAEMGRRAATSPLDILANVDAVEVAIREAAGGAPFNVDDIRTIHRRLMERAPHSHIAGRIRTVQDWIGGADYNPCGADYVPPPPEEVPALLDDLCRAMADDGLPPLVQAALVHAQFEILHPFDDGNGRTGRALIHVVLRRREIAADYVPPISMVLAADKALYIAGLAEYREDALASWLEHFAAAAARSAQLAQSYLAEVRELMDGWRDALAAGANPRSDAAAWAVIEVLPAHPIITAPIAAAATGRAKSAVNQAVVELEEAGILLRLSRSRRNRSWEAAGLLDLIAGLEAGKPPRS